MLMTYSQGVFVFYRNIREWSSHTCPCLVTSYCTISLHFTVWFKNIQWKSMDRYTFISYDERRERLGFKRMRATESINTSVLLRLLFVSRLAMHCTFNFLLTRVFYWLFQLEIDSNSSIMSPCVTPCERSLIFYRKDEQRAMQNMNGVCWECAQRPRCY